MEKNHKEMQNDNTKETQKYHNQMLRDNKEMKNYHKTTTEEQMITKRHRMTTKRHKKMIRPCQANNSRDTRQPQVQKQSTKRQKLDTNDTTEEAGTKWLEENGK